MWRIIIFLVVAFAVLWQSGYAQNPATDAKTELSNASKLIDEKKYSDAMTASENARKAIIRIIEDELSKALPASLEGWIIENESGVDAALGLLRSQGSINVSQIYVPAKAKTEGDPQENATLAESQRLARLASRQQPVIVITITNDFSLASAVTQAHVSSDNPGRINAVSPSSEPARVQGYRALFQFHAESKQGDSAVIVGAAVVRVQGRNIDSVDILKKFTEAVNFSLIKSLLGE